MIPWIVSPYSFDGSVIRFEKLVSELKKRGLKSALLADRNFHAAVKFNTTMREHGLIPVHGLWKEGRVFIARNRKEYDLLVRFYNGEKIDVGELPSFKAEDLVPVRYLEDKERDASLFMRRIFELDEDVHGFPERCEDVAEIVKAEPYDLRVKQKFPDPPENWYKELRERASGMGKKYAERLERELRTIEKRGFSSYIYLVEEIVKTARRLGIKVGPGRGSAVGSLVVFLCGITEIDPLKYDLLFERFINEERRESPDIDVDVEDRRRKELLRELSKKFYVYQVATFGNLTEKFLRNLIDSTPSDPGIKERVYKILYGLPHHPSVHAAGVVISESPLLIPFRLEEEIPVTDYDMYDLDKIGVVKIDILGLRALSFVKDFNRKAFDYSDEKTYHIISKGKTLGVFQLEGLQARKLCRKISPSNLEELSVLLALNRPGPLKSGIDSMYVSSRNVPDFLKKLFPETRGVVIYQEQIMNLAMLAGLSGAEADVLRRAIAKKEKEKMEPLLTKLKEGLVENGVENADLILKILLNFSSYAFNKSHSVAYAHLSFQTAYLKTHLFEEFFEKYFEYNIGDSEKIFLAVQELRSEGYEVLPPSVNVSGKKLIFRGNRVYLPLTAVKGVGESMVEEIEKERPIDSVRKLQEMKGIPRNVLENMISAGAFDEVYESRAQAFEELNRKVEKEILEIRELFGERIEQRQEVKPGELIELEEKSLGFPLTPQQDVPKGLFGSIADVFTYGKVLPVLARKVSKNVITDGISICRVREDPPEGLHLVLLSPLHRILRVWSFDENTKFVYRVNHPTKLEKAGKSEVTEILKDGLLRRYEGYRPSGDEYRYRILK
ncbi:DNA polymerase III subunit alpha [Thermotoga sp.]|uniref:helix-hairpin-helix domain-containing protein n=1 Tax=Thermotoga sp. TaxID=28240 RepID=UPI0025F7269F|nr:DNA polymerase III subunit alpha [Thermotoga sp.]MCD6552196.1 DNA polymerase III subunit alpha [Thermotoga sp.]